MLGFCILCLSVYFRGGDGSVSLVLSQTHTLSLSYSMKLNLHAHTQTSQLSLKPSDARIVFRPDPLASTSNSLLLDITMKQRDTEALQLAITS